ncbi:DUF3137 domain-containing protein [Flammeovirga sp. SJP92]|uniref:DUF3137 domain-containing protein n=1 Tax=Flammeovirga sp. SJP92 TaxID=1775430 RepID=UPI0007893351|nr:DUF3137 domain-containing protein [Flammeovirga sp. SJP92]KXX70232.1 hypothetical protein AVL50_15320 [Flammeovirga sp. SJP92]
MKTKQELNNFLKNNLKQNLKELDEVRLSLIPMDKKVKFAFRFLLFPTFFLIITIGMPLLMRFIGSKMEMRGVELMAKELMRLQWSILKSVIGHVELYQVVILLLVMSLGIIYFFVKVYFPFLKKRKEYEHLYSIKVKGPIFQFLDKNWKYTPSHSITLSEYNNSRLAPRQQDSYSGKDLIEGHFDNVPFKSCEIHTQYFKEKKETKQWYTIFRGIFFSAELDNNSSGDIILISKDCVLFRTLVQHIKQKAFKDVSVNNEAFNRIFKCNATNEKEFTKALNSKVFRILMQLKECYNGTLGMSIIGTKLYVTISTEEEVLKMQKITEGLIDIERIEKYFEVLQLLKILAVELNSQSKLVIY